MKKLFFRFGLALVLTGLLAGSVYSLMAVAQTAPQMLQLAANISGQPITAGDYIFWTEVGSQNITLRGYNQTTGAKFVIADDPTVKSSLASDSHRLVWVQAAPGGGQASIESYDLASNTPTTLIPPSVGNQFGGLAITGDTLYYNSSTPGHSGLYARDLAGGPEQLLSPNGQNPVVGPGVVVWSEELYQGEYRPSLWDLYLLKTNAPSTQSPTLIAQSTGQFEVALSGESLVWSALPPATERKVYSYNLSINRTGPASSAEGRQPVVRGNTLAWVVPPAATGPANWEIQTLDNHANRLNSLVSPGSARLSLAGFVGSDRLAFVVGQGDENGGTNSLYLTSLSAAGPLPRFDNPPPSRAAKPKVVNPLNCGQVYKSGYQLYDCNGRWTVNGVQFILPERGINGQSFWDANYQASVANGQVDYWLNQAALYLQPSMLRLFVDMPTDTLPGPTSPATLYDFASRAAAKGMRLGLVLHNDGSWTLTPARKQWISDLITYFRTRGALPLLAYLNADNEINNHCGVGTPDCFDNNPTYVNGANSWVADFTAYVHSLNSGVLVTVGISSEKSSADSQPTVYDFFRTTGAAPSMAASVDFLSPHNYQGGGYSIWPALRYNLGYTGPIVLEEYGYSTDLLGQNPYFTEGPAICRTNPFDNSCLNTAPYFVEVNLRAQRENWTDGFAGGSAWMLADSNRKDCGSPGDFYTGLLASGDYPRCTANGTTTITTGSLKATGTRVRFQYTGTTGLTPAAPTNLTATLAGPNLVNLSWVANSPLGQSFQIERKGGAAVDWTLLATVSPTATTYQDNQTLGNTVYSYRVRAAGDGNTFSAYSNIVTVTTPLVGPTNLVATPRSPIEIDLTWADNSKSETGFALERRLISNTTWATITTLGPNSTSYNDRGLLPGTGYAYRVRAVGANGNTSAYSNEVTATTGATFDYTITVGQDDGSRATGTLSEALSKASAGQSIRLAPPGNLLTVSGLLPSISTGLTLVGSCANGPAVSLRATFPTIPALTFAGRGAGLYGLRISGFAGPQLQPAGGAGYWLECVKVEG